DLETGVQTCALPILRFLFDVVAHLAIEMVEVGPSRRHHVPPFVLAECDRSRRRVGPTCDTLHSVCGAAPELFYCSRRAINGLAIDRKSTRLNSSHQI